MIKGYDPATDPLSPRLRAKISAASAAIDRELSEPEIQHPAVAAKLTRTAKQALVLRLIDGDGIRICTVARMRGETYKAVESTLRRARRAAGFRP